MTGSEVCAHTVCFSRSRFTGKERDAESGNDYFGARYYASSMGRWMSPDLPFADQDTENPQSWNLYSYVRNNPLNHIDDSGMLTIIVGGTGYNPHDWNYSHSPLTSEAQSHFNDPAVGFLYWSGGLSDRDRIAGAEQLRKMINNYDFAPGEQLNIIAHSHGGNVALLASQNATESSDRQSDYPRDARAWGIHAKRRRPWSVAQYRSMVQHSSVNGLGSFAR